MKAIVIKVLFFILLILSGCKPVLNSEKEWMSFLANPKNGYVKKKVSSGIELTVKYLPATYLTYKELSKSNYNKTQIDSIYKLYKNQRTFLLAIKPDVSKSEGDVMYKDVGSYPDYKKRVLELNFEIGDHIRIKAGDKTYLPVLFNMENTYSLTDHRNFYLVFSSDDKKKEELINAEKLDFIFEDDVFGTGINHFSFEKNKIDSNPSLSFFNVSL